MLTLSKMKLNSKIISLLLGLCLVLSLTLTGVAATRTSERDGLEVTISTDKDSYSDSEPIKVSLSVKNTNNFSVENVKLENLIPDGFELDPSTSSLLDSVKIKADETITLETILIKVIDNTTPSDENSSDSDSSNTPSSDTNNNGSENNDSDANSNTNNNGSKKNDSGINSNTSKNGSKKNNTVVNSNTRTTTKKKSATTYNNNASTSTTGSSTGVVYTGDDSHLLMWVGIALSALFAIALTWWLKKNKDGSGKAMLSLFLALSILASTLALSTFKASAENSNDSGISTIVINTKVSYASSDVTLIGKVSYNDESFKSESITKYQWIKMLIEKLEYDYETIADHSQAFDDVDEDNEYYPYVQAAVAWDIIDENDTFNGDQLATEYFVGITGVRSIGPARLTSVFLDRDNYNNADLFEVALQNNIAMGPEGNNVDRRTCNDRLDNIINYSFSDEANREYENVEFKESVIQLPGEYPYSDFTGDMIITNVENQAIKVGDVVSFHTEDGTFLAGEVIDVLKENGKSVLHMDEVSPEEVFDQFSGVISTDLTAELLWDYYESISEEDEAETNTFNGSGSDNEKVAFDPSKEITVESLLNQNQDEIMATPLANNENIGIEVKLDYTYEYDNIDSEGKNKVKVTVKDLSTKVSRSFNISADKIIKTDDFEFEESNKDKYSFSITAKMENVKIKTAVSLIAYPSRSNPNLEVALSGDFSFELKGTFAGEIEIPIPSLAISKKFKVLKNTAAFDLGLFYAAKLEGELDVSFTAPSTKISSGVYFGSGIRNYNSFKDNPPEYSLEAVMKGETGLKLEAEFVLMSNYNSIDKGIEFKLEFFAGPGAKASINKHKTYSTCADLAFYLSCHGSVSARINFWTEYSYKMDFFKIDDENPPHTNDLDFIIKLHFEKYYDKPEQGFVKVDKCTYIDGNGLLTVKIGDFDNHNIPIEGATISIFKGDEKIHVLNSNSDGKISLNESHGNYRILIEKDGYLPREDNIEIQIDEETTINYYLLKKKDDRIYFGSYPIESEDANPTPISWRILYDDGTFYTLMMDPVLFSGSYGGSWSEASWANSDMRKFLNEDFFNKAFTANEQADIADTTISFWSYAEGAGYSRGTTTDKVFILSADEYKNTDYGFSNLDDPSDTRIPYYNEKSIYLNITTHFSNIEEFDSKNKTTWVWTRDVHANNFGFPMPTYVTTDGGIYTGGHTYSTWQLGLQPVIIVRKDSQYIIG